MDYDVAVKIGMFVIGLVSAGKLVYDVMIGKHARMRDEYKFAKDFLEEVKNGEKLHPYLLEKGYQAIAGDGQVKAAEVKYLLSLTGPDRALRDYVLG